MAKKPMQFQVSEDFRDEIETIARKKDITISELIRQSIKTNMILSEYLSQGYRLILKRGDTEPEKEIIFP